MVPTLEAFSALVQSAAKGVRSDKVLIDQSRISSLALCAADAGTLAPVLDGDWTELLLRVLFSVVNYRFVNLATLERPVLGTLTGSQAFELDLRQIVERYGVDRPGMERFSSELQPDDFSESVRRGVCDPMSRVFRLRYTASWIALHWDSLRQAWQVGNLDAVIRMVWFTGLFLDPFHKRLQHLAFALMRHVTRFHHQLTRADRLTILSDYRLPELFIGLGVLLLAEDVCDQAQHGCLRLRGSDPLVTQMRAATIEVGTALSSLRGVPQIAVDQMLWHEARRSSPPIALLIDTDAF